MQSFYAREVAIHNNETSCWIIANGNVYDVTHWLKKHPVGQENILKYAGQDCTIHYNFHSKIDKKIWKKYKIGCVKKNKPTCCIL